VTTNIVLVGGGAAGISLLVSAMKYNRLKELLDGGFVWVEEQSAYGGRLGGYSINSNSKAGAFVEDLESFGACDFKQIMSLASVRYLVDKRCESVPLTSVGKYLEDLGRQLAEIVRAHGGVCLLGSKALKIVHLGSGFELQLHDALTNTNNSFRTNKLVLALGGQQQSLASYLNSITNISRLHPFLEDKLLLTERLLSSNFRAENLKGIVRNNGPIVIIGGSHSAFSSAWVLLNLISSPDENNCNREIRILHRQPIKVQYQSVHEARENGYSFCPREDVCFETGKVNRYGGLYEDAKKLYLDILSGAEKRVALFSMSEISQEQYEEWLIESSIVIPAFGYISHTLPICNAQGELIDLKLNHLGGVVMDEKSHPQSVAGEKVENLYHMGLMSDKCFQSDLGGEASYKGKIDGVWLYQNVIGKKVLDSILGERESLE
jgi:hypothetical protein